MARNQQDPRLKGYLQRHTVTIEMDSLAAELYAPQKLRRLLEERPGAAAKGGTIAEEHYVITTRRWDLEWEHTVSAGAEEWRIPPQVVDWIIRDRELIIWQQRSDRGLEQAAARRRKKDEAATEGEHVALEEGQVFLQLNYAAPDD